MFCGGKFGQEEIGGQAQPVARGHGGLVLGHVCDGECTVLYE